MNVNGVASKASEFGASTSSGVPSIVASNDYLFLATNYTFFDDVELLIRDKQGRERIIDVFPGEFNRSLPAYFHVRQDKSVMFISRGDAALYQIQCPSEEDT